jgi:hypothetical protein
MVQAGAKTIILLTAATATGCKVQDCIEFVPPEERIQVQQVTDTFLIKAQELVIVDTTICPPGDSQQVIIKTITKTVPGQIVTRTRMDTVTIQRSVSIPQIREKTINRHLLIAAFLAGMLLAVIIAAFRHVW